jgi:hypothetical protein
MKEILGKWWRGNYVEVETDEYGNLPPGTELYQRHWSAKGARLVAGFWMKYWQWCFTAAFSVTGLIIAAMKL